MDYRARERQRKSDRPAKLNAKKGDRDLEQEIKNKGDIFLLEEQHQHENFVAAVTMLTAINARRKWQQSQRQIFQEDISTKTNEMFNRNEIELKAKFTVVYLTY